MSNTYTDLNVRDWQRRRRIDAERRKPRRRVPIERAARAERRAPRPSALPPPTRLQIQKRRVLLVAVAASLALEAFISGLVLGARA
jgi:hypothetical protein